MPGNRLAVAFVELELDRRRFESGLAEARGAFKDGLEAINRDWLSSVKLREQAEIDLAAKLDNLRLKPTQNRGLPESFLAEKEMVARNFQIMEDAAKRYEAVSSRATSRVEAGLEAGRIADLNAMRAATSQLGHEEQMLLRYREQLAAQQQQAAALDKQKLADLEKIKAATAQLYEQSALDRSAQKGSDLNAMRAATAAISEDLDAQERIRAAARARQQPLYDARNRLSSEEAATHHQRMAIILGEAEAMDALVAAQVRATQAAGGGGSDRFRPMSQAAAFQTAGISVRQYQQALIQLGYGIQDFAVMYGPMGLRGALQASINNFSMIAMSMGGPVKGAIIGTAATLVAVGVSAWMEYIKSTEKAKEKVEEMKIAFREFDAVLQENSRSIRDLKSLQGSTSREDVSRRIGESRDTGAEENRERMARRAEIERLMAENARRVEPGPFDRLARRVGDRLPLALTEDERKANTERIRALEEANAKSLRAERDADKLRDSAVKKARELTGLEIDRERAIDRMTKTFMKPGGAFFFDEEEAARRVSVMQDKLTEKRKDIEKQYRSGVISKEQADFLQGRLQAEFERDARKLEESGRETTSKKMRDFAKGLRDDITPGFAPIGKILDELDERKRQIGKFNITEDEKNNLVAASERAAQVQISELNKSKAATRLPASFSGIAEFEQKQQLSMLDSGQDEAIKKTAKFAEMSVTELQNLNKKTLEVGFAD